MNGTATPHHVPRTGELVGMVHGLPAIIGRTKGRYYWYRPGKFSQRRWFSARVHDPTELVRYCGVRIIGDKPR